MVNTNSLEKQLPLFQALSSEIRVQIMNLILSHNGINQKQIASALHISVSTLNPHIARLADCGLIRLTDQPASHGTQKCCYPCMDQIMISFDARNHPAPVLQDEIPIGHFTDFAVMPTCGMATVSSFLGKIDEPRSFAHHDRYQAGILWFTTGYVEYVLPNFIPHSHKIDRLSVSFEISSEAPNYCNDWPSDIEFFLNGTNLGVWTSPGDYGDHRGAQNPAWWYDFLNQYGLLKKLVIDSTGTWLDDIRLSDNTVQSLRLTSETILKLRFSVNAGSSHAGGLTLYGRGFGDHNQDIRVSIEHSPAEDD